MKLSLLIVLLGLAAAEEYTNPCFKGKIPFKPSKGKRAPFGKGQAMTLAEKTEVSTATGASYEVTEGPATGAKVGTCLATQSTSCARLDVYGEENMTYYGCYTCAVIKKMLQDQKMNVKFRCSDCTVLKPYCNAELPPKKW